MALLDLNQLKLKYSLDIKKIAHIGAHKGQEVEDYLSCFPDVQIHLFEPQKKIFSYLEKSFGNIENISLHNFALGSMNSVSSMYISGNEGLSSSFLKPKEHLIEHPEIKFQKDDSRVKIKVLDELDILDIDFLNIDTQGFELEILKGSQQILTSDIKYLILEINKKEIYEGCPHIKEVDLFLKKYNFVRTDTHYWMDSYSWGDAFYIKKNLITRRKFYTSILKNSLYNINILYDSLIVIRNFLWKLKR